MAEIEIYATMFWPFCYRAKRLLDSKGAAYRELDVTINLGRRREMMERAGGRHTVPQIFIDGRHIGGSDELYALEASGELDQLLEGRGP